MVLSARHVCGIDVDIHDPVECAVAVEAAGEVPAVLVTEDGLITLIVARRSARQDPED